MVRRLLTLEDAKYAIYGGCILGGGGGGWIDEGSKMVEQAFEYGQPELITIDELSENDYVACVSLVGAPSAKDMYVDANQFIDTVKQMQKAMGERELRALMTNENGAATTINGWLQAAAVGLPIIDAPCNGRAHPTGSMGSMNLSEVEGYESLQAFAGGKGEKQIAGFVSGTLSTASDLVRNASVLAGGMVGVCRNPVTVEYIKEHAAVGGISQAIELGKVFFSVPEGPERIEAVASHLKGRIIHSGMVSEFELKEQGGFDVGFVRVDDLELTFWNEYMTAEIQGERKGTFPDLIMTFNAETGMPIVSAEMKKGLNVAVISIPKENLILSSTMYNEKLLKGIEPIIEKKII